MESIQETNHKKVEQLTSECLREQKYNGWTNKNTWALKLHMDSNEGYYTYWQGTTTEIIKHSKQPLKDLTEEIKEWYDTIRNNVISKNRQHEPTQTEINLILDISNGQDINYKEIAEELITENKEQEAKK